MSCNDCEGCGECNGNEETKPADRFEEIITLIKESLFEAREIVKDNINEETGGESILARADAYWFPQIDGTVDGQSSMCSMQNTLDELREDIAEQEFFAKEDREAEQQKDEKRGTYPDRADIAN